MTRKPEYNIHDWLDPKAPLYKPQVSESVFHYGARITKDQRLRICIQTQEMKEAAWKYCDGKQLILDGTFGICDRRVLLFIAMGVDEEYKGIPLAFFLFSAPTGNRAMHAGYDTSILHELLVSWCDSLGSRDGLGFKPLCRKNPNFLI